MTNENQEDMYSLQARSLSFTLLPIYIQINNTHVPFFHKKKFKRNPTHIDIDMAL